MPQVEGLAHYLKPEIVFLSDYIIFVGQPTMTINTVRNNRYGPGGSARRLHHFSSMEDQLWGRNRIDEGVKTVFLPGMVPPLSGRLIVANDNYAEEVALAA